MDERIVECAISSRVQQELQLDKNPRNGGEHFIAREGGRALENAGD